jgi:hypothetical protein
MISTTITTSSSAPTSKDVYPDQQQPPPPLEDDEDDSSFRHSNFSSLLSPMTSSSVLDHQYHSRKVKSSRHHLSGDAAAEDAQQHSWQYPNRLLPTQPAPAPQWSTSEPDTSKRYAGNWQMGSSSTSVIGSQIIEGREISQHSRGDEHHQGNGDGNIWGTTNHHHRNSSNSGRTTHHQPHPPPPQIHGSNTDEFSKSSRTSAASVFLNNSTSSLIGGDDDIDVFHDVTSNHHESSNSNNTFTDNDDDPIMESSRFLSSLQLHSSGFDHHHQYSNQHDSVSMLSEQKKNQPPKQPVRRPSYGYNNNPSATLSSSSSSYDHYPLFVVPNSLSQDSNTSSTYSSSQPQYASRSTDYAIPPTHDNSSFYYGSSDNYNIQAPKAASKPSSLSSALQKAANANPYYPTNSSSHSVASTIPGLMNAHSGSVTTTKSSATNQGATQFSSAATLYPPPPVIVSSSLAAAASSSRGQYHQDHQRGNMMMFGGPPPPGFVEHQDAEDGLDDFDSHELSRPRSHHKSSSSSGRVGPQSRRGHSPPALKDRNSNLPHYHQSNRSGFGLLSGGGDMKDDLHSVTSTTTATTTASLRSYQVPQQQHTGSSHHQYQSSIGTLEPSMSSSQALRALMDNTTSEPSSFGLAERRQSSSLLPSSLSSFDPVHRDASSPILPQPVIQSDYFLSSIEQDMERHLQRQTFLMSSSNNINDDGIESLCHIDDDDFDFINDDDDHWSDGNSSGGGTGNGSRSGGGDGTLPSHHPTKKREWLHRMNRKLNEIPIGELDATTVPVLAIMNAWAKTKSAQGAAMVELWLKRAQEEYDSGNRGFVPTTKMYTMAGKISLTSLIETKFESDCSHIYVCF